MAKNINERNEINMIDGCVLAFRIEKLAVPFAYYD